MASPTLRDPNFERTVVLLLEHNDDGALGLTLNRNTDLAVTDVLPLWEPLLAEPPTVFAGGPVEREMAVGLAWRPDMGEDTDWRSVLGGVGVIDLGDGPDAVGGVETLRVFSGYAGWEESQLELELAIGSWFVLDSSPVDVFDPDPGSMWRRVLARQRGSTAFYADFPEEVHLN